MKNLSLLSCYPGSIGGALLGVVVPSLAATANMSVINFTIFVLILYPVIVRLVQFLLEASASLLISKYLLNANYLFVE